MTVGAVCNRALYCARGFLSLRALFLSALGPVSVGQDRPILPYGAQAIAIYRGAPACVDGRRGLSPRLHGLRVGFYLPRALFLAAPSL